MSKPASARYRTTNWSSYNASLRRRGSLLIRVDKDTIWRAPGALLEALDADLTGAVDFFDTEPMRDLADPLLAHPNLICTPHIGFVTDDEFDRQFADIFAQINAFAANEPINKNNPEVLRPAAGGRPPARR